MIIDKIHHLFFGPSVHRAALNLHAVFIHIIFDDLICAETFVALFTVHQRVGKPAQMSGSNPGLRIHKYRTVHTYIIRAFLNKFLPPCFFYIVFKLHAKISIIPCICQSAVNLRSAVHKTSGFC